jgi:GTP-binding protein
MIKRADEFFVKNQPVFKIGAVEYESLLTNNLKEFAFIGRSNVGKSSLINAITNSKIAIVSKTPGRTRQINFFQIGNKLMIVDMPGYGYAKAGKSEVKNWNNLIFEYISKRINLKRVFLLIDSRHNLKSNDEDIMGILDKSGTLYQIILTKIDEISTQNLESIIKSIDGISKKHPALYGEILFSSSNSCAGISKIRDTIYNILQND